MTHVATLISNPATPAITDEILSATTRALPQAGAPVRLDGAIAADLPFAPPPRFDPRALSDQVRSGLEGAPLDVVVQPLADRRKRLFVADMDSTMIEQECLDELADIMGFRDYVSAITERAMRGEIAFEPALRERVALLKGLPAVAIDDIIAQRIRLTPGGRTLVATMRANGAYTCLVSGGFTVFTDRIAAVIGFDENRANRLVIDEEGKLAGLVEEPILGRQAKWMWLEDLRARLKLAHSQTLAVGDGANDLEMLQAAGLGVAYHAKPTVSAAAHARIDHGDLTALLYAQGYRREEFVNA